MLLLAIIYIAFIGLGLPDSLIGAAWPAIYQDLNLPFSFGSFITAIIYCGTMLSSMFSAQFIRRFGTWGITAFSTALTAAALFGFSLSNHYIFLCLFAVPLGLGAGSIDTALNNYVSLHYKPIHMNFLHCFYGIGVVLSPYIISNYLHKTGDWHNGYRLAFVIQTVIALILIASMRVWKKEKASDQTIAEENTVVLSLRDIVKTPSVIAMWVLVIGDSVVESLCNTMGATYLVEQKAFTTESAATIIIFYYVGMTAGRFAAGLVSNKIGSWKIIKISQIVLVAAAILTAFSTKQAGVGAALFCVGFGVGPIFPNLMYVTPELFGAEKTPSIMGTQMAIGSMTLMLSPVMCALLGQWIGMQVFPVMILIFVIAMIIVGTGIRKKQ